MISVLLVDDSGSARKNVRALLETLAQDIQVIGEADNGIEGVRQAQALRPDVVLLDMRMPGGDGLDAVEALCGPGVADPIPVLVYTTFHLDEYVYGAMERGAVGYLLKKNPGNIPDAIRAAVNAKSLHSTEIRERLMADWARNSTRPRATWHPTGTNSAGALPGDTTATGRDHRDSVPFIHTPSAQRTNGASPRGSMLTGKQLSDILTERELEVAAGIADGLSVIQIGERIDLSPNTVKGHIKSLYKKSGAGNRVELAFWLTEYGLRR